MLFSHYSSLDLPLPRLAILALSDLFVHEWYDEQRTRPLQERIHASGVFRNPPIVTPMLDGSGRYVVLDGANRTAAMRALGYPYILAQIIQVDDPGLRLRTWNHVLLDIPLQALLDRLKEVPDLDMASSDEPVIELPDKREIGIALFQIPTMKVYSLSAPAVNLPSRVAALNAVVDTYKNTVHLERTAFSDIGQVAPFYTNMTGLMIFPKFNLVDLVDIVKAGCLLPAGITRTTVSPRALYVNLPLNRLQGQVSLEQANCQLNEIICRRIDQGKIEIYTESAFMFDE
jgi:hypothetical protein